jgi:hypothetical protein
MGLLQESDCFILRSAGQAARQRGLLEPGKSLTCPIVDCGGTSCWRADNPQFRTIYVASAQTSKVSQTDKFYRRLSIHSAKGRASS